jgi:hypothetical protein
MDLQGLFGLLSVAPVVSTTRFSISAMVESASCDKRSRPVHRDEDREFKAKPICETIGFKPID